MQIVMATVPNLDKTTSLHQVCSHDDNYKIHDSVRWYDINVHILHYSQNKMEPYPNWNYRQQKAHQSHRYNEWLDCRLGQCLYIVGHLHRCTGCHDTQYEEGDTLKQCVNETQKEVGFNPRNQTNRPLALTQRHTQTYYCTWLLFRAEFSITNMLTDFWEFAIYTRLFIYWVDHS